MSLRNVTQLSTSPVSPVSSLFFHMSVGSLLQLLDEDMSAFLFVQAHKYSLLLLLHVL